MGRSVVFATAMLAGLALARPAAAVELALVLLTDVSKSMDDGEFAMVKDGYRVAFSDPEVAAAITNASGGVAVAYVEFSGPQEIALVRGWTLLTDADSARAFGESVAAAPRSSAGGTALWASLKQAAVLLDEGDFAAARRVIDITSDHPWDGGRAAGVRDKIVAEGVVINGLPIVDERVLGTIDGRLAYTAASFGGGARHLGGIVGFFRRDVIGGPGSFVVEARDHGAYGAALKRKLLMELIAQR